MVGEMPSTADAPPLCHGRGQPDRSDRFQVGDGSLIANAARVQRGFWLKQYSVRFFLGNGQMVNSSGDDDKLALI
ncbi:MAG: hypothetical protein A3H39_19055 [candidate division NC10 bacterium RIFCSPLOWO2_02_FULL_66_22]|nr:MAG: hypothetical protein A3H39_19055 [candidate division NC10 bacterium RIFCSPLOWO2_02_FULL_66_22]